MIPANVGGVSAAHDYPELQTFFRSESRGPTKTIQKHTFVTDSLAQPLIENPNERYTHVCYERPPDLSFGKLKVNRPHRSQSWQSYHPQHLTSQHDPAKSEDSSLAILFLFPSPWNCIVAGNFVTWHSKFFDHAERTGNFSCGHAKSLVRIFFCRKASCGWKSWKTACRLGPNTTIDWILDTRER